MSKRFHEPKSRLVADIARPSVGDHVLVRLIGEIPSHVDVRAFDTTRVSHGELRPTHAGLSLKIELLDELIRSLIAAREAAR